MTSVTHSSEAEQVALYCPASLAGTINPELPMLLEKITQCRCTDIASGEITDFLVFTVVFSDGKRTHGVSEAGLVPYLEDALKLNIL